MTGGHPSLRAFLIWDKSVERTVYGGQTGGAVTQNWKDLDYAKNKKMNDA